MIDLKRNSKKEPVKATGLRTRASSSYSPNQKEDLRSYGEGEIHFQLTSADTGLYGTYF